MTVYVVAQLRFTDRTAYDRYQARFMDVFRKFDGRVLAADEHPVLLEEESDRQKVVVLSFADETSAKRFLTAPEYIEISKDRYAGADTISWMVTGLV